MNTKLFVANLPFSTTESDLLDLFMQAGGVASCRLVVDSFTNKSRGCAFVEMRTLEDAACAVSALDGTELDGRILKVGEVRGR